MTTRAPPHEEQRPSLPFNFFSRNISVQKASSRDGSIENCDNASRHSAVSETESVIRNLQTTNEDKAKTEAELMNQLSEISRRLKEKEQILHTSCREKKALEEELHERGNKIENLASENEGHKTAISELKDQLFDMQDNMEDQEFEKNEFEVRAKELASNMEKLQEEMELLQKQRQAIADSVETLEKEVNHWKEMATSEERNSDNHLKEECLDLENACNELKLKAEQNEADNISLRAVIDELTLQVQTSEQSSSSLNLQIENLQSKIRSLEAHNANLLNEAQMLRLKLMKLQEVETELKELKEKNEALVSELYYEKENVLNLEGEVKCAQEKLNMIDEDWQEKKELQKQVVLLKNENAKQSERLAVAEEEIETYDRKVAELSETENGLEFSRDENHTLRENVIELQNMNESLNISLGQAEKENMNLKDSVADLEMRLDDLVESDNSNKLSKENSELRLELDSLRSTKSNEGTMVFDLKAKIIDIHEELLEKSSEMDRVIDQNDSFREKLKKLEQKYNEAIDDVDRERHNLLSEKALGKRRDNEISKNNIIFEDEIGSSNSRISDLTSQKKDLETEVNVLKSKQVDEDILADKVKSLEQAIERLELEYEQYKVSNSESNSKSALQCWKQLDELQSQLTDTETRLSEAQSCIAQLELENKRVVKDNVMEQAALRSEVKECQREKEESSRKLNKEIQDLKESYSEDTMKEELEKKEELTVLQSMFTSVESELNSLRSDNSSINAQIVTLKEKNATLSEEISTQDNSFRCMQHKADESSKQTQQLRKEIYGLKEKLSAAENSSNRCSDLKTKLEEMQSLLSTVRVDLQAKLIEKARTIEELRKFNKQSELRLQKQMQDQDITFSQKMESIFEEQHTQLELYETKVQEMELLHNRALQVKDGAISHHESKIEGTRHQFNKVKSELLEAKTEHAEEQDQHREEIDEKMSLISELKHSLEKKNDKMSEMKKAFGKQLNILLEKYNKTKSESIKLQEKHKTNADIVHQISYELEKKGDELMHMQLKCKHLESLAKYADESEDNIMQSVLQEKIKNDGDRSEVDHLNQKWYEKWMRMKDRLMDLESLVHDTNNEKEKACLEGTALRAKVKSLEDEVSIVSSLKMQLLELRKALEYLENENKDIDRKALKSVQEETEGLSQQVEAVKKRYNEKEKKLRDKLLTLTKDNEQLKTELDEKKIEYSAQVANMDKILSVQHKDVENLCSKYDAIKIQLKCKEDILKEIDQSKERLRASSDKVSDNFKCVITEQTNEIDTLKLSNTELQYRIEEKAVLLTDKEAEIHRVSNELNDYSEEQNVLRKEIFRLENLITSSELEVGHRINELMIQLEASRNTENEIKKQYEEVRNDCSTLQQEYNNKLAMKDNSIAKLLKASVQQEEELLDTQHNYDELKSDRTRYASRKLQRENEMFAQQLIEQEEEIQAWKINTEDRNTEHKRLSNEIKSLKKKISVLDERLKITSGLEDERLKITSGLEDDYASINRTLSLHKQEISLQKKKIKDLKLQLADVPSEIDHAMVHKIEINKLEATIEILKMENKSFAKDEFETEDLKIKLEEAEACHELMKRKIDSLEKRFKGEKIEKEEIEDKLSQKFAKLGSMQVQVEELKHALNEKEKSINSLEQVKFVKLGSMQVQVEDLKHALNEKEKTIQSLVQVSHSQKKMLTSRELAIESAQNNTEKTRNELLKELSLMEIKIATLSNELSVAMSKASMLELEYDKKATEFQQKLDDTLQEITSNDSAHERMLSALRLEHAATVDKLHHDLINAKKAKNEMELNLNHRISTVEQSSTGVQSEIDAKTKAKDSKILSLEEKIDSQDQAMTKMRSKMDQLQCSMEQTTQMRKSEVEEMQREVVDSSSRSMHQEREIAKLKMKLEERKLRHRDDVFKLKERIIALEQHFDKDDYKMKRKHDTGNDAAIIKNQKQIYELNQIIKKLQSKNASLVVECKALNVKITSHENDVSIFSKNDKYRHTNMKDQVRRLTTRIKDIETVSMYTEEKPVTTIHIDHNQNPFDEAEDGYSPTSVSFSNKFASSTIPTTPSKETDTVYGNPSATKGQKNDVYQNDMSTPASRKQLSTHTQFTF